MSKTSEFKEKQKQIMSELKQIIGLDFLLIVKCEDNEILASSVGTPEDSSELAQFFVDQVKGGAATVTKVDFDINQERTNEMGH